MSRILFAFPHLQDPFFQTETGKPGPILRCLQKKFFDRIALFGLPDNTLSMTLTEQAIRRQMPSREVQTHLLSIVSFSYKEVFAELKKVLKTSFPQKGDSVTLLLPSQMQEPLLDCWLLLALRGSVSMEVDQADRESLPEVAYVSNKSHSASLWELHDVAGEKAEERMPLSKNQFEFLCHIWAQGNPCCLKIQEPEQQRSVLQAIHMLTPCKGTSHGSIFCDEIPAEYSYPLLWGYQANLKQKNIIRKGLLTNESQSLLLFNWDAFSEDLKSTTVSFLCRTNRHFMVLSRQTDEYLQIPTYVLPQPTGDV